jgi:hypothetical protein
MLKSNIVTTCHLVTNREQTGDCHLSPSTYGAVTVTTLGLSPPPRLSKSPYATLGYQVAHQPLGQGAQVRVAWVRVQGYGHSGS